MTDREKNIYHSGSSARSKGKQKGYCPYPMSCLRDIKNRHIWLAGWHDKDIELEGKAA